MKQAPPAGSLTRLPLARRMLHDDGVRLVQRRLDTDWWTADKLRFGDAKPKIPVGFRPFSTDLLAPSRGLVATWLAAPETPLRELNVGDKVIGSLLFMIHDYLHAWTASWIARAYPKHWQRCAAGDEESREVALFLHLATEACATAGLDYWYLSTIELRDEIDCGTCMRTLTTSYHESDVDEFRRHWPKLHVQSPSFLVALAQFYCTSEWEGFSADDLRASPLLLRWLRHEIGYARKQRAHAREFLAYAHGSPCAGEVGRPVDASRPWQRRMLSELAEALWALVKNESSPQTTSVPDQPWPRRHVEAFDARFGNLATMDEEEERALLTRLVPRASAQAASLAAQFLGSFDADACDPDKLASVRLAVEHADPSALFGALKGEQRLPKNREPHFVMFVT